MIGFLILDKPLGLSSNYALRCIKKVLPIQKCGFAGTLDPLATGVLPIALGRATKVIPQLMAKKKEYVFDITFGEQRTTDDAEGSVVCVSDIRPSYDELVSILPSFQGEIQQKPPVYSAVKVGGRRAYEYARKGENIELNIRNVHIYSLIMESYTPCKCQFRVICGSGTYVRSLARDIARAVGGVGYVSFLRRTAVGPYGEERALTLEKVLELGQKNALQPRLSLLKEVLDDIPAIPVSSDQVRLLLHGRSFVLQKPVADGPALCVTLDGKSVALVRCIGQTIHPKTSLYEGDT